MRILITGGAGFIGSAVVRAAIAAGHCSVALITLAGKPRSSGQATGTAFRPPPADRPDAPWESSFKWTIGGVYAMMMQRHMHEFLINHKTVTEKVVIAM